VAPAPAPALHRRIAADLREKIVSGELGPGDRLPTEPELRERYGGISRNTVRLAVAQLANEGLITTLPGRGGGSFVRDQVALTYYASRAEQADRPAGENDAYVSEVIEQGRQPHQRFSVRIEPTPLEVAERLQVEEGAAAVIRRCMRYVDGHPWSIQDSYYPMDLAEEVRELLSPDDIPQGTTRLLADRGHRQVGYRDELLTRMPTPDEARALELGAGVPVIAYTRTGYTPTRPVRCTVTTFAGDRNRLVYELGDLAALYDGDSS
jgi:GntR family transcriptional regulator